MSIAAVLDAAAFDIIDGLTRTLPMPVVINNQHPMLRDFGQQMFKFMPGSF